MQQLENNGYHQGDGLLPAFRDAFEGLVDREPGAEGVRHRAKRVHELFVEPHAAAGAQQAHVAGGQGEDEGAGGEAQEDAGGGGGEVREAEERDEEEEERGEGGEAAELRDLLRRDEEEDVLELAARLRTHLRGVGVRALVEGGGEEAGEAGEG